jgi:hypothetical protein
LVFEIVSVDNPVYLFSCPLPESGVYALKNGEGSALVVYVKKNRKKTQERQRERERDNNSTSALSL